jgi:ABC-type polysaccharide/polyol phosphate export permease
MWTGETRFAVAQLVMKDYRVRYRNMSLGIFWSLLNPLVMMLVYSFVLTKIFVRPEPAFPVFLLCGMIPVGFFQLAWLSGTTSLVDNAGLIKRVPLPREVVPVASVLSNALHLAIQFVLLTALAVFFGKEPNRYWLLMPLIWSLFVIFIIGLALITAPLNVYVRDTRYIVESINLVMIWIVPVFYSFSDIPDRFRPLFYYNPVCALTMAMRNIVLDGRAPADSLLIRLAGVSVVVPLAGYYVFRRMKGRFYNHL